VINPVNLALIDKFMELSVQVSSRFKIITEWLLDYESFKTLLLAGKTGMPSFYLTGRTIPAGPVWTERRPTARSPTA
jgi:hypothetical protein